MMKQYSKTSGVKLTSEIHVGLLVLILILVSLNFLSNLYIYRQKANLRDDLVVKFTMSTIGIARSMASEYEAWLDDSAMTQLQRQFGLANVAFLTNPSSAGETVGIIAHSATFPHDYLQSAVYRELQEKGVGAVVRGKDDSYYFASRLKKGNRVFLLVLAYSESNLAYLEDAGNTLFIVGCIGMLVCLGVYFVLYRSFVKPFKILRAAAQKAGRGGDLPEDNVEAVIARYQQIIEELQDKERELRKLHETAQRRAKSVEGFNQYIVGSMQTGLLSCSPDGNIIAINDYGAVLLGVDKNAIVGTRLADVFALEKTETEQLSAARSDGKTITWREAELTVKSAKQIKIGYSASQIHDESGAVVGFCVLFSDITELHKLRVDLEQSRRQAALGEMAAGLAHQLRNSLGAIVGYGRLIRRNHSEPETVAQRSETLVDEATQANELISRFLELSKPMQVQFHNVDMADFLNGVVSSLQMQSIYQHRNITVKNQCSGTVWFDPLLMKQAITNLVENALQASENGTVTVAAQFDGSMLTLAVTDTGKGIAPEVMEKLFTPFYSSRPDGNGLGLVLARKIVELHGGRVSLESVPGQGTTCTVMLFSLKPELSEIPVIPTR